MNPALIVNVYILSDSPSGAGAGLHLVAVNVYIPSDSPSRGVHQGRPELKGLCGGAGSRGQPKSEFSFAEAAYSLGVMPVQRLNTREKCWRVE